MKRSVLFAAAALCLAGVGPVLAQAPTPAPGDPLPAGPGKDVVVRVCTACHDATQFAFARYTPEEWDNEISKMQSAGAEMTAEDQTAISAYLAKTFPKAPPEPPTKRDDR
jgi:cytochrome c5